MAQGKTAQKFKQKLILQKEKDNWKLLKKKLKRSDTVIKNLLAPLAPYMLLIKIGAIVVFIIAIYGFGYTNARNKYEVKVD